MKFMFFWDINSYYFYDWSLDFFGPLYVLFLLDEKVSIGMCIIVFKIGPDQ